MVQIFGYEICKTPLQIQLVITERCNRRCVWCIERENMSRFYKPNDKLYLKNLRCVLNQLGDQRIPANVVLTGGEPTLNLDLALGCLDICKEVMPAVVECFSSDSNKPVKGNKVGINSNGDQNSPLYNHSRLNYIDISFIDTMRSAQTYNGQGIPIRLQTTYRKSVFAMGLESVVSFIDEAITKGYDDILFRQLVGEDKERLDIFAMEKEVFSSSEFRCLDYQINVYDLWTKYAYKNHDVYFKRQDLDAQLLFERMNRGKICSLVFWPDGKLTKSWDYSNELFTSSI